MVTAEHLSIEFESQESKILKLTNSCVAMTAGDALAHTEVFKRARSEINSSSISQISQVVEKLKEAFVEERKKRFEEMYLKPRGMTLEDFYGDAQKALDPNISLRLDRELEDTGLDLQILVAGVDQTGAHLYVISDPGTSQCFDALGFCGIGSGYPHAMSTLIFNNYDRRLNLKRAVYLVYEAKRRSEAAPGVGLKFTDMAIIDSDGIHEISEEKLNELRKIYEAKTKLEKPAEIDEMINKLNLGGVKSHVKEKKGT